MTTAPTEPKQRLICETIPPAGGRPAASEGADPEIARLRQRLDRAEQETRIARAWAWMMFSLALTSGIAVSLLAARVADRATDESGLQVLLRTLTDRHRTQRTTVGIVPAPSLPAAPPAPATALQPAAAPKPQPSIRALKPVRSVSPTHPAASPAPSALRSRSATRLVAAAKHPAATRPKRQVAPRPVAPMPAVASSFSSFRTPGRPGAARTAVRRMPQRKPGPVLARTPRPRLATVSTRKPHRRPNYGYRRASSKVTSRQYPSTRRWTSIAGSSYRRWSGSRYHRTAQHSRWAWRSAGSRPHRNPRASYRPRKARPTYTRTNRSARYPRSVRGKRVL
jgi:hypothetical protein